LRGSECLFVRRPLWWHINFGMDIDKHNWWTYSTHKHTSSLNCRLISGDGLLIRYTIHTILQLWFLVNIEVAMYSQMHLEVWGKFLRTRLRFPALVTKLLYWLTNSQRIDPYLSRNNPAHFCKIRFNIIFYSYCNDPNILFCQILLGKVIIKMPSTQPCRYYIAESYMLQSQ
jgi:hypothetical protein